MKWLTALQLQQWSERIPARTVFPELVGALVQASAPDPTAFRFPGGDKGQVRGFDGRLEASVASTYVPEGKSIWEFGISPDACSKAESDILKRTPQVPAEERAQTTFVFATLHTWDNPKYKLDDWIRDQNASSSWKEVRFIDGAQLEHWLDNCPAVAARYARSIVNTTPPTGATSIDEYWNEYSTRFQPPLTEDVLLCDREAHADTLIRGLTGSPSRIVVAADSPDEVIAFAVAAIRKAAPDTRGFIESRTLVVSTEDAARYLATRSNVIFLPRGQAADFAGLLARTGPTLVALGREDAGAKSDTLPRPNVHSLGRAIETMGIPAEQALHLARGCGRSVTIIARRIPSGRVKKPTWISHQRALLPALLAGGWDTNHAADKDAIANLSGTSTYQKIEDLLRPLTKSDDPFVDRAGTVWRIRAPIDAFVQLGHLLGHHDFDRLKSVITSVFTVLDDDFDKPISPRQKDFERPSPELREGLANILLQIAVLHEEAELDIPNTSAQEFVNSIIRDLPGLAGDARLMISLRDLLPILAEAAPDPLLSALERTLEGSTPTALSFFINEEPLFGPTSPHVYLLWALEILAWDPNYFQRSVLIIVGLAAISQHDLKGNSPLESLRNIFLLWNPGTNAPAKMRMATLNIIAKSNPAIAWDLITRLLPRNHDHSMPPAKPRLRESYQSEREIVTRRSLWQAQREIISKAFELAGSSIARWVNLINGMADFQADERNLLLSQVRILLVQQEERGTELWMSLRDQLNKHRSFAKAAWAMPEVELTAIAELVEEFGPLDEVENARLVFDQKWPRQGRDFTTAQKEQLAEQKAAIRSLHASMGIEGILDLASKIRLQHLVAQALPTNLLDFESLRDLVRAAALRAELDAFLGAASAVAHREFDGLWDNELRMLAQENNWPAAKFTQAILTWPDNAATWSYAQAAGHDVELEYWTKKRPFSIDGPSADAERAALMYVTAGRAAAAIEALHDRMKDLDSSVIFKMLDGVVADLNQSPSFNTTMISYYLANVFNVLECRSELDRMEIAQREYILLPFIEHDERPLTLHKLMASNPSLYVEILSDVFRAEGSEATEKPSDIELFKARTAYTLLSNFSAIPGDTAEGIDENALRSWIAEVRQQAKGAQRQKIADQYIGHVLAHASEEGEAWPPLQVCTILEELASIDVESGIEVERFNMRGAYTKALYEGGIQERELARKYHGWRDNRLDYKRTAAMLDRLAKSWGMEAEREDLRAAKDELRS